VSVEAESVMTKEEWERLYGDITDEDVAEALEQEKEAEDTGYPEAEPITCAGTTAKGSLPPPEMLQPKHCPLTEFVVYFFQFENLT
jgi:hypothetical protein